VGAPPSFLLPVLSQGERDRTELTAVHDSYTMPGMTTRPFVDMLD
jgi:hypothetical protein